jgi:predicted DNA-binding WGR domain protein
LDSECGRYLLLSDSPENSNKFQKTRFWNEKSVEDVIILGPMAQATLVRLYGKLNRKGQLWTFLQKHSMISFF